MVLIVFYLCEMCEIDGDNMIHIKQMNFAVGCDIGCSFQKRDLGQISVRSVLL